MARGYESTPDRHLERGNYHWKRFDERLHQFGDELKRGKIDSQALLRAYRHAFAAEINYGMAKGATELPLDVGTREEACQQAKKWRKCLTKMIGKMLEDCPPDSVMHYFNHCTAEMNLEE